LLKRRREARPAPTPGEIDALFAPLAGANLLLLAVSGGPDSTALLLMASEWAARGKGARVAAATVDHGLRPEGAVEALAVADLSRRLGVPHHLLAWRGEKPATRIQERAREARYRLLGERARLIGAEALVTAHHADDQAETVLFRLLRGSGLAGLRGMARATDRDGLRILRPLLELEKADLVAFCEARGVAFVHDPSNANPHYARTRLRRLLPLLAAEGLDSAALRRLARRAGEVEAALGRQTAEVETRLRDGGDGLDARKLFGEPLAIAQRILAGRIAAVGGRELSQIGLEKIERVTEELSLAQRQGRAHGANLAGAVVRLSAKGALRVLPEPRRRAPPATPVSGRAKTMAGGAEESDDVGPPDISGAAGISSAHIFGPADI
jgi:tRNA(Ile)-lysidine synthase